MKKAHQTADIRHAILEVLANPTLCTASICDDLRILLGPHNGVLDSSQQHDVVIEHRQPSNARTQAKPAPKSRRLHASIPSSARPASAALEEDGVHDMRLTTRERRALATEVVNAALSSLTRLSQRQTCAPSLNSKVNTTLHLSTSAQPTRSLYERSANLPSPRAKAKRVKDAVSERDQQTTQEVIEHVAHCCSDALTFLDAESSSSPNPQLEQGYLAFVSKLIALRQPVLAAKGLKLIKQRLIRAHAVATSSTAETGAGKVLGQAHPNGRETLITLLQVQVIADRESAGTLSLVTSYQMLVLQAVALTRKSALLGALLPVLDLQCASSPISLLSRLHGHQGFGQLAERQLDALSKLLLSLCPGLSRSEDQLAGEGGEFPKPGAAFDLQTLALEARASRMKLAQCQASIEDELLAPLQKCLVAYIRRSFDGQAEAFTRISKAVESLIDQAISRSDQSTASERCIALQSAITETVASVAEDAGLHADALRWMQKEHRTSFDGGEKDNNATVLAVRRAVAVLKNGSRDMPANAIAQLHDACIQLETIGRLDTAHTVLLRAIMILQDAVLEQRFTADTAEAAPSESKACNLNTVSMSLFDQCLRLLTIAVSKKMEGWAEPRSSIGDEQLLRASRRAFDFAIRAALSFTKTHDGDRVLLECQLNRLQRCEVICPYLDCGSKGQKTPTKRLTLSNTYIGLYLSSKHTLVDISTLFLERSCATLGEGTSAEKKDGGLAARLATLARAFRDEGRWDQACTTWRQFIDVFVSIDALGDDEAFILENASGKSPSQQYRLLEGALAGLLEVNARHSTSFLGKEAFFDDPTITSTIRWHLLECQLRLAIGWLGSNTLRPHALEMIPGLTSRLLDDLGKAIKLHQKARVLAVCIKSYFQQDPQWQTSYITGLEKKAVQLLDTFRAAKTTFGPVQRHLFATLLVLVSLLNVKTSKRTLEEALHQWYEMLEHSTGIEVGARDVDTDAWLDLLVQASEKLRSCGRNYLCLAFLRLRLRIAELIGSNNMQALLDLAMQHQNLDETEQAGLYLEIVRKRGICDLGNTTASCFWLATAQYHLSLGLRNQAGRDLQEAWTALQARASDANVAALQRLMMNKLRRACSVAQYHQLCTQLVLANGMLAEAVRCAKLQTSTLQRAWRSLHPLIHSGAPRESNEDDITAVTLDVAAIRVSEAGSEKVETVSILEPNPGLRRMVDLVLPRLTAAYTHLAELQAYSGLFLDAAFTLDQCQRAILGLDLCGMVRDPLVRKGDLLVRSGRLVDGAKQLQALELNADEPTNDMVMHQQYLGHYFQVQQQWKPELEAYERGREMIRQLASQAFDFVLKTNPKPSVVSSSKPPRKPTRAPIKSNTPRQPSKAKANASQPSSNDGHESITQASHSASQTMLLCLEAESYVVQHDAASCGAVLSRISPVPQDSPISAMLVAVRVQYLLQQAMLKIASDSMLAMLPDSTISVPSASLSEENVLEESFAALDINSPQQKPVKSPRRVFETAAPSTEVATRLREVCEISRRHQILLIRHLPLDALMKLRSALATASMMLAYVGQDICEPLLRPATISFWLDLPRSVAAYRERSYLLGERLGKLSSADEGHQSKSEAAPTMLETLTTSHNELPELLPRPWTVVSLALDTTAMQLLVTRYNAGRQPFVVRLPLARQSDEVDEQQVFSFSDAQKELQDIIANSDSTVHSARDNPNQLKVAGARTQWWANREALNSRLEDLLRNIENMWLGGFRSLFSQQLDALDILSRFQQSFENILDKHLPSRQKSGQRMSKIHVKLDRHVLELFTGLTEQMTPDMDLEEALTDLLYYVIDILQFHGEPNAYDEIDFDAVIVEVQTALEAYRQAAELTTEQDAEHHTILVLDKELHMFPWESMPCLQNKSVSRVHSLYDLHERMIPMSRQRQGTHGSPGMHVCSANGSYILNPGCDLQQTQSRFEEPLSSLSSSSGWSSIVGREPSEAEVLAGLNNHGGDRQSRQPDNRIFLYIGHGSGEQYIRHRKIKGLRYAHLTSSDASQRNISSSASDANGSDSPTFGTNTNHEPAANSNVSAALLFGCSSASLRLYSEYEPHGTPKSYMAAGAPALLGSLWDVTDGDVDRFAGNVLERWGLFEKGTFEAHEAKMAKGKRKTKAKKPEKVTSDTAEEKRFGSMCLSEAAGRSRGSCYLKYLNGAAMVVYGVPVYLDKRV